MLESVFIDPRLSFRGMDDFWKRKYDIKECFKALDINQQYLYQWYLYSRPFIDDTTKNYIWDFLQDDMLDYEFAMVYCEYKKKHRN